MYNQFMPNFTLKPAQWTKILDFLRKCPDAGVGDEGECKLFLDAALWMARAGAPRRTLPESCGNWNSIYKRFARWTDKGVWQRMREAFADDPHGARHRRQRNREGASLGGGSAGKRGGQPSQALGRSGGGFSAEGQRSG